MHYGAEQTVRKMKYPPGKCRKITRDYDWRTEQARYVSLGWLSLILATLASFSEPSLIVHGGPERKTQGGTGNTSAGANSSARRHINRYRYLATPMNGALCRTYSA